MKTITIDYDTYQKELLAAKQDGFELIPDLKSSIAFRYPHRHFIR